MKLMLMLVVLLGIVQLEQALPLSISETYANAGRSVDIDEQEILPTNDGDKEEFNPEQDPYSESELETEFDQDGDAEYEDDNMDQPPPSPQVISTTRPTTTQKPSTTITTTLKPVIPSKSKLNKRPPSKPKKASSSQGKDVIKPARTTIMTMKEESASDNGKISKNQPGGKSDQEENFSGNDQENESQSGSDKVKAGNEKQEKNDLSKRMGETEDSDGSNRHNPSGLSHQLPWGIANWKFSETDDATMDEEPSDDGSSPQSPYFKPDAKSGLKVSKDQIKNKNSPNPGNRPTKPGPNFESPYGIPPFYNPLRTSDKAAPPGGSPNPYLAMMMQQQSSSPNYQWGGPSSYPAAPGGGFNRNMDAMRKPQIGGFSGSFPRYPSSSSWGGYPQSSSSSYSRYPSSSVPWGSGGSRPSNPYSYPSYPSSPSPSSRWDEYLGSSSPSRYYPSAPASRRKTGSGSYSYPPQWDELSSSSSNRNSNNWAAPTALRSSVEYDESVWDENEPFTSSSSPSSMRYPFQMSGNNIGGGVSVGRGGYPQSSGNSNSYYNNPYSNYGRNYYQQYLPYSYPNSMNRNGFNYPYVYPPWEDEEGDDLSGADLWGNVNPSSTDFEGGNNEESLYNKGLASKFFGVDFKDEGMQHEDSIAPSPPQMKIKQSRLDPLEQSFPFSARNSDYSSLPPPQTPPHSSSYRVKSPVKSLAGPHPNPSSKSFPKRHGGGGGGGHLDIGSKIKADYEKALINMARWQSAAQYHGKSMKSPQPPSSSKRSSQANVRSFRIRPVEEKPPKKQDTKLKSPQVQPKNQKST